MILYEKRGNIFDSTLDALVCPVNTAGAMGKGLALQFKQLYPQLLWAYRKALNTGVFSREGYFVWRAADGRFVVCIPTKRHWRDPSKLNWIDEALARLAENWESHGFRNLAIPGLGCGEGKLRWEEVRPVVLKHFAEHPLPVGLYPPFEEQT